MSRYALKSGNGPIVANSRIHGDYLRSVNISQIPYEMIPAPLMCKACVEGKHDQCSYKHCECRKLWHWSLIPILHGDRP